MFTDLKPYPAYVDSGNQWLGRLPAAWETSRLRGVSQLLVSNVDKLTHEDERPIRLCNYVDVYNNDFITDRPGYMAASASDDEIRRFRVRVDDVAITKDSESWTDIGVPAYVAQEADDLVCGYHLGLLRTRKDRLSGAYLFRALQVPAIATQFHVAAGGVTRYGLSQNDIRSASVPIPSLSEQASIVKYLGHASSRIDRAIASKRKLIALLEEKKQALISQAVTRGLDPTVSLKDSGIPWIGDLPTHWNLVPARAFLRQRKLVVAENNSNYELLSLSLQGVIPRDLENSRGKFPSDFLSYQSVEPGNFVMCLFDVDETPRTVGLSTRPGMVSGAYKVLRCEPQEFAPFLYYFLLSLDDRKALKPLYTGLRKTIPIGQLLQSKVPIPPPAERARVVARIEAETSNARWEGERMRREIELLQEFKARLTADVVTGQVDIQEAAARLPALDPADPVGDVVEQDADELNTELDASLEEFDA